MVAYYTAYFRVMQNAAARSGRTSDLPILGGFLSPRRLRSATLTRRRLRTSYRSRSLFHRPWGRSRVNVASSAVELTPQRAAWLLELVVSVSTTCHGLAIISYLLSPAHFLILAYRIVLQVQFTLPRRVHANRSLRFFVALWGLQAAVAIALHAATGSQGTKGPTGYVQRGLVLDFVGQGQSGRRRPVS